MRTRWQLPGLPGASLRVVLGARARARAALGQPLPSWTVVRLVDAWMRDGTTRTSVFDMYEALGARLPRPPRDHDLFDVRRRLASAFESGELLGFRDDGAAGQRARARTADLSEGPVTERSPRPVPADDERR